MLMGMIIISLPNLPIGEYWSSIFFISRLICEPEIGGIFTCRLPSQISLYGGDIDGDLPGIKFTLKDKSRSSRFYIIYNKTYMIRSAL